MTALGGIVDIFSTIKEYKEDTLFTSKAVEQMTKAFGNMDVDDAIKAFRVLGVEGEDLVEILLDCGVKSDVVEASLKKAGKTGIPLVTKLKDGFKGFAGMLGMTASQLGVFMAALAIPAIVVASAKAYSERIQECVDNAKTAAEMWSEQNAELEKHVSTLEDFNKKLKDGNLTEEESYQIKSDLYSMQQNISERYGNLASDIDLVNGKLEEEIQKVKDLTAAWANEFVTENRVGGQKAVDEMTFQKDYKFTQFNQWKPGSGSDVVDDILSHFSDTFDVYAADAEGVNFEIRFTGNPEDAKKAYGEVLQYIRDSGYDVDNMPALEAFRNGIEAMYNQAKGTIDEYGDLADQFMDATLKADNKNYTIGIESKRASDWVDEYKDSVEDYNKALKSGDQNAIAEAAKEFSDAKSALETAIDQNGNTVLSQYASQINDITNALDVGAIKANDFKRALSGDDNVLERSVDEYGKQLKSMGLDDIDLKAMLNNSNNAEFGEYQFRQLIDAAYDYGLIAGKTADDVQPLIDILIELGYVAGETASQTQAANEKIVSSYNDAVQTVSSLKSELGAINGAISEQGYGGNLSVDTYNSLIAISKDYADCIEYQNGALQLNAEKANMLFEAKSELKKAEIELQKITEATKWKENADEIARLTKEHDGLDPAIKSKIDNLKKENDGIEANLIGYDLQIAAIEELTSAYGRWKAVSESDNSDSMYKDIQNAYKAIKEAQKTGQTGVGNVVYQAAVELLVPEGEDVKKYMSTLQRYITDGSNGLSNFINDMVSKGLMERSKSDWNKVSMVAGTTMQEIMDKMTLTPEMAKAIFNALEMYDFDFHWTDEDFNINTDDAMADLKAAQEEMNKTIETINKMKEAGATVDLATGLSLDDLEKKYAEQKSQVDKLMNSATGTPAENTVEYTITANTEKADEALDTIKSKLEEVLKKVEDIFKKELGDLGGGDTLSILKSVLNTLRNINAYKIADKTFTVTQYTTSTGTKPYGSISSHDQNIKNDTSAHAAVASGTRHATAGVALVGDEYSPDGSPKPELIITDGAAYVAGQHGPEFVNLKDGDQVVPADKTEKILNGNPGVKRDVIQAFATGAGGYPAGSIEEDKYLEGVIGPHPDWVKKQKEAKNSNSTSSSKKDRFDKLAADGVSYEEMSSAMATVSKNAGATISGSGNSSSLRNPGGSGGGGSSGGSGSSDSSDSSKKEKSQFEKDYEAHNHLVAMEKESYEDYLKWLEGAYEDAYNKGEIELEDYRKYMEEVFEGQKELFQDSIEDIEHKIKALEREPGNEREIINYYNRIITKIDAEIAAARARGLNDDDDYIQELLEQKWDYADEIADIEKEITENAKDAVDELVDYRVDMLKQEIEDHKDALNDKLDALKDFYDEQKQMLQDSYDEEKYLEEQNEKRRSVSDIKDELDQLRFDNSAAAEKRKLELQEELKAAEKDLSDFEKDKALQDAMDLLDKQYEQQEKDIQSQIDELDAKLNDPNALFNQALSDIKHNTAELYGEMVAYNNAHGDGNPETIKEMYDSAKESLDQFLKTFGEAYKDILLVGSSSSAVTGYASGTSHATKGVHELFEGGKDEYVYQTKDGHRYKMFSGLGDKVLNASATDFLYKFANNGEAFITNIIKSLFSNPSPTSLVRSPSTVSVSTGDIVIQGSADSATVSEIRRAQRENVNHILREFVKLNR